MTDHSPQSGSRTYPLPLKVVLNIVSTANRPPVAVAGPDQQVMVGSVVTLSGEASYDSDGDPITYLWTIEEAPEGSAATLSDPSSVHPTLHRYGWNIQGLTGCP